MVLSTSISSASLKVILATLPAEKKLPNRPVILFNRTTEKFTLITHDELFAEPYIDGNLSSLYRPIAFPRLAPTLTVPGTHETITLPKRISFLRNLVPCSSFKVLYIDKMGPGGAKRCRTNSDAREKQEREEREDPYERDIEMKAESVVWKMNTGRKSLDEFNWSDQLDTVEEDVEGESMLALTRSGERLAEKKRVIVRVEAVRTVESKKGWVARVFCL